MASWSPAPGETVWIANPYAHGDESYRAQWLPSRHVSRPSCVPAVVTSLGAVHGDALTVLTLLSPRLELRLPLRDLLRMGAVTGSDDVAEPHAQALAHSLARRALEGHCVTRAGPSRWLSVNPCRVPLDAAGVALTDVRHMARVRAAPPRAVLDALPLAHRAAPSASPPPPHMFEVAQAALDAARSRSSRGVGGGAGIAFVGSAGSGKSEAYKSVLSYLVSLPALHAAGVPAHAAAPALRAALIAGAVPRASAAGAAGTLVPRRHVDDRRPRRSNAPPFIKDTSAPALGRRLLLSEPDLEAARRDAARRQGPLGTARNPWVTHTSYFSPLVGATAAAVVAAAAAAAGEVASSAAPPPPVVGCAVRAVNNAMPRISRVLLAAHTVIEAFGCAATHQGGANSSRHVRSCRLTFSEDGSDVSSPPRLLSATLDAVLLEPRRVLGPLGMGPTAWELQQQHRLGAAAAVTLSSPGGSSMSVGTPTLGTSTPLGRNFHIFYQLTLGMPRDLRAAMQLGAPSDYLALHSKRWGSGSYYGAPSSSSLLAAGGGGGSNAVTHGPSDGALHAHGAVLPVRASVAVNPAAVGLTLGASGASGTLPEHALTAALWDSEELACTMRCLAEIDVGPAGGATQAALFRVVAGVLMASNVLFASGSGAGAAASEGATISTPREAALLSNLWGVSVEGLTNALVRRSGGPASVDPASPRKQSSLSSGGVAQGQLFSPQHARLRLESLQMSIYTALFAWLVRRANAALTIAAAFDDVTAKAAAADGAAAAPALPHTESSWVVLVDSPGIEGALPAEPSKVIGVGPPPLTLSAFYPPPPPPPPPPAAVSTSVLVSTPSASLSALTTPSGTITVDIDACAGLESLVAHTLAEQLHELWCTNVFRVDAAMLSSETLLPPPVLPAGAAAATATLAAAAIVAERSLGMLPLLEEAVLPLLPLYTSPAPSTPPTPAALSGAERSALIRLGAVHRQNPAFFRPSDETRYEFISSSAAAVSASTAISRGGTSVSAASTRGAIFAGPSNAPSLPYDASIQLFAIKHYCGSVIYSATGWGAWQAATGNVHSEVGDALSLLAGSTNPILRALVHVAAGGTEGSTATAPEQATFTDELSHVALGAPGNLRGVGALCPRRVLQRAARVLAPLGASELGPVISSDTTAAPTDPILTSSIFWVQCLRPNASLAPAFIDLDQLESGARACNALDALASHANSFAVQASYGSFFSRYALFSACGQAPPASAASAARCLELLRTAARLDTAISTLAGGDILRSVSITPQSSDSAPPPFVCGATTIFLSAPFYDALERLRELRSALRFSRAAMIQALFRGWQLRRRFQRMWSGIRAIQSAWRSTEARIQFLAITAAATRIQAWARAFILRRSFLSKRARCSTIQRWARMLVRTHAWRSQQTSLRCLHALARGYLVRGSVVRMLRAATLLQSVARRFIVRLRKQRAKNAAASALVAAWRGFHWRLSDAGEHVLSMLAHARAKRLWHRAAVCLQAIWRGALARRHLRTLRQGFAALVRKHLTTTTRRRFLALRSAVVSLQAHVRGYLQRLANMRLDGLHELAALAWRQRGVRLSEANGLARGILADMLPALPPGPARLAITAAAGLTGGVDGDTASGSLSSVVTALVQQVPMGSVIPQHPLHMSFSGAALIDIDATGDTLGAFPTGGLATSLAAFETSLHLSGTRLAGLAVGASHVAALVDGVSGLFVWGWGASGQCGQSRFSAEPAPRLLESTQFTNAIAAAAAVDALETSSAQNVRASVVSQGSDAGLLPDPGVSAPRSSNARSSNNNTVPPAATVVQQVITLQMAAAAVTAAQGKASEKAATRGGAAVPPSSTALGLQPHYRIKSIACGEEHTLALGEADGVLFSWGGGRRGQLGSGRFSNSSSPEVVRLLPGGMDGEALRNSIAALAGGVSGDAMLRVSEIAAGAFHSLALTSAGLLFAWGNGLCTGQGVAVAAAAENAASLLKKHRASGKSGFAPSTSLREQQQLQQQRSSSQLLPSTHPSRGDVCTPQLVRALARNRVRHMSSGPAHVAVVTVTGDVWTWGANDAGQLGLGWADSHEEPTATSLATHRRTSSTSFRPRYRPTPLPVGSFAPPHSRIMGIACGARHCVAVSSTGRVWAWGANDAGQLGLGALGVLPELVLRRAGVTLPPNFEPKWACCPTPAWVWTLENFRITTVLAGARSSAAYADERSAFAWGATQGPLTPVSWEGVSVCAATATTAAAAAVAAAAVANAITTSTAGSTQPQQQPTPRVSARRDSNFGLSTTLASSQPPPPPASPPPIFTSAAGELTYLPTPTALPMCVLPGRTARRLLTTFSSSASLLLCLYSQVPISESTLRDLLSAFAAASRIRSGAAASKQHAAAAAASSSFFSSPGSAHLNAQPPALLSASAAAAGLLASTPGAPLSSIVSSLLSHVPRPARPTRAITLPPPPPPPPPTDAASPAGSVNAASPPGKSRSSSPDASTQGTSKALQNAAPPARRTPPGATLLRSAVQLFASPSATATTPSSVGAMVPTTTPATAASSSSRPSLRIPGTTPAAATTPTSLQQQQQQKLGVATSALSDESAAIPVVRSQEMHHAMHAATVLRGGRTLQDALLLGIAGVGSRALPTSLPSRRGGGQGHHTPSSSSSSATAADATSASLVTSPSGHFPVSGAEAAAAATILIPKDTPVRSTPSHFRLRGDKIPSPSSPISAAVSYAANLLASVQRDLMNDVPAAAALACLPSERLSRLTPRSMRVVVDRILALSLMERAQRRNMSQAAAAIAARSALKSPLASSRANALPASATMKSIASAAAAPLLCANVPSLRSPAPSLGTPPFSLQAFGLGDITTEQRHFLQDTALSTAPGAVTTDGASVTLRSMLLSAVSPRPPPPPPPPAAAPQELRPVAPVTTTAGFVQAAAASGSLVQEERDYDVDEVLGARLSTMRAQLQTGRLAAAARLAITASSNGNNSSGGGGLSGSSGMGDSSSSRKAWSLPTALSATLLSPPPPPSRPAHVSAAAAATAAATAAAAAASAAAASSVQSLLRRVPPPPPTPSSLPPSWLQPNASSSLPPRTPPMVPSPEPAGVTPTMARVTPTSAAAAVLSVRKDAAAAALDVWKTSSSAPAPPLSLQWSVASVGAAAAAAAQEAWEDDGT